MTLTGIDLTRYKEKLLAMLQAFDEFCTAHSLQYFAAYGTAIGAVRHQDIIPWDDDIDLYMPRKDYKRLMSIRQELPPPFAWLRRQMRATTSTSAN